MHIPGLLRKRPGILLRSSKKYIKGGLKMYRERAFFRTKRLIYAIGKSGGGQELQFQQ
jgi:hypothetical protein